MNFRMRSRSWRLRYFDLKGVIDLIVERLGLAAAVERFEHPALHPGRSATLALGNQRVGVFGELRPDVAAAFGIEEARVSVAELDLTAMLDLLPMNGRDVKVARFLPVVQDFAIVVDDNMPSAEVEQALRLGAGALVTSVRLFDVFRGAQIGEGKKSLAFRVTFTAPDRALTDVDIEKIRPKIEKTLKRIGGALRV
jgi:phenylalanyl-tRNA synthetase beta chain